MGKICAFFGHRDVLSTVAPLIENQVRRLITEESVDTFWLGGYGNFDACAASVLRRLQGEYPNITILLIIAYPRQLERYGSALPFDGFEYPAAVEAAPRKFAISARNRYMAEYTDFAIGYVQKEYGGAYDALKTAANKHKTVINLAKEI